MVYHHIFGGWLSFSKNTNTKLESMSYLFGRILSKETADMMPNGAAQPGNVIERKTIRFLPSVVDSTQLSH